MLAYYGDLNNDYLSKDGEVFDERLDISDRHDTLHQLSTLDRKKGFGVKNYDRLPGKQRSASLPPARRPYCPPSV